MKPYNILLRFEGFRSAILKKTSDDIFVETSEVIHEGIPLIFEGLLGLFYEETFGIIFGTFFGKNSDRIKAFLAET